MVLNMPSIQLLRWVTLPGNIELRGLDGTVSQGSIGLLRIENVKLHEIDFLLQPTCLIYLSVCYQLQSEEVLLGAKLEINAISQKVIITDAQIEGDETLIGNIPGLLLKPAGDIGLHLQELTLAEGKIGFFQGSVDWKNAGISGDSTVFGNYRADIQLDESGVFKVNSEESNTLNIKGNLDFDRSGQYSLDFRFRSSPALQESVKSLLEASLEQTGLDQYRLRRSGTLNHHLFNFL